MPAGEQLKSIREQILQQTKSMRFSATEISPIGSNAAQSGPEDWTVCVRDNPSAGGQRYFMFFVRGSKVIDGRTPVLNDKCETREYQPFQ